MSQLTEISNKLSEAAQDLQQTWKSANIHNENEEKESKNNRKHNCNSLKRAHFPDDDSLIMDYLEPFRPTPDNCTSDELIAAYIASCKYFKVPAIDFLLEQLKGIDLSICNERYSRLSLKDVRFARLQIETLEEVFRRVHFREIDLEESYLDEASAIAFFDMMLHYETCIDLTISLNLEKNGLSIAWSRCISYLRKSSALKYFKLSHTPLSTIHFIGLSLSGLSLQHLCFRDCSLSGPVLFELIRWLRFLMTFSDTDKSAGMSSTRGTRCPRISFRNTSCVAANGDDGLWALSLHLPENRLGVMDAETLLSLIRHQLVILPGPPTPAKTTANGHEQENKPIGGSGYLEELNLAQNNLRDEGVEILCTGLLQAYRMQQRRLEMVTLQIKEAIGENKDSSLIPPACALPTVRGLERLSLADNGLTSANNLSYTLSQSTPRMAPLIGGLTHLDLSNNLGLGDDGIEELCEGLIHNATLRVLILRNVRMGFGGVFALSGYLGESKVLTVLDIRQNTIDLAGIMALAKTMTINTSLTTMLTDARSAVPLASPMESTSNIHPNDDDLMTDFLSQLNTCLRRNRTTCAIQKKKAESQQSETALLAFEVDSEKKDPLRLLEEGVDEDALKYGSAQFSSSDESSFTSLNERTRIENEEKVKHDSVNISAELPPCSDEFDEDECPYRDPRDHQDCLVSPESAFILNIPSQVLTDVDENVTYNFSQVTSPTDMMRIPVEEFLSNGVICGSDDNDGANDGILTTKSLHAPSFYSQPVEDVQGVTDSLDCLTINEANNEMSSSEQSNPYLSSVELFNSSMLQDIYLHPAESSNSNDISNTLVDSQSSNFDFPLQSLNSADNCIDADECITQSEDVTLRTQSLPHAEQFNNNVINFTSENGCTPDENEYFVEQKPEEKCAKIDTTIENILVDDNSVLESVGQNRTINSVIINSQISESNVECDINLEAKSYANVAASIILDQSTATTQPQSVETESLLLTLSAESTHEEQELEVNLERSFDEENLQKSVPDVLSSFSSKLKLKDVGYNNATQMSSISNQEAVSLTKGNCIQENLQISVNHYFPKPLAFASSSTYEECYPSDKHTLKQSEEVGFKINLDAGCLISESILENTIAVPRTNEPTINSTSLKLNSSTLINDAMLVGNSNRVHDSIPAFNINSGTYSKTDDQLSQAPIILLNDKITAGESQQNSCSLLRNADDVDWNGWNESDHGDVGNGDQEKKLTEPSSEIYFPEETSQGCKTDLNSIKSGNAFSDEQSSHKESGVGDSCQSCPASRSDKDFAMYCVKINDYAPDPLENEDTVDSFSGETQKKNLQDMFEIEDPKESDERKNKPANDFVKLLTVSLASPQFHSSPSANYDVEESAEASNEAHSYDDKRIRESSVNKLMKKALKSDPEQICRTEECCELNECEKTKTEFADSLVTDNYFETKSTTEAFRSILKLSGEESSNSSVEMNNLENYSHVVDSLPKKTQKLDPASIFNIAEANSGLVNENVEQKSSEKVFLASDTFFSDLSASLKEESDDNFRDVFQSTKQDKYEEPQFFENKLVAESELNQSLLLPSVAPKTCPTSASTNDEDEEWNDWGQSDENKESDRPDVNECSQPAVWLSPDVVPSCRQNPVTPPPIPSANIVDDDWASWSDEENTKEEYRIFPKAHKD